MDKKSLEHSHERTCYVLYYNGFLEQHFVIVGGYTRRSRTRACLPTNRASHVMKCDRDEWHGVPVQPLRAYC